MKLRIGNVDDDDKLNQSISPYYHVDKIKSPILIVQGSNDPRVSQDDTDEIVSIMKEKGVDVEYVVYSDEGHSIVRPLNRLDLFNRIEIFLDKHLIAVGDE